MFHALALALPSTDTAPALSLDAVFAATPESAAEPMKGLGRILKTDGKRAPLSHIRRSSEEEWIGRVCRELQVEYDYKGMKKCLQEAFFQARDSEGVGHDTQPTQELLAVAASDLARRHRGSRVVVFKHTPTSLIGMTVINRERAPEHRAVANIQLGTSALQAVREAKHMSLMGGDGTHRAIDPNSDVVLYCDRQGRYSRLSALPMTSTSAEALHDSASLGVPPQWLMHHVLCHRTSQNETMNISAGQMFIRRHSGDPPFVMVNTREPGTEVATAMPRELWHAVIVGYNTSTVGSKVVVNGSSTLVRFYMPISF